MKNKKVLLAITLFVIAFLIIFQAFQTQIMEKRLNAMAEDHYEGEKADWMLSIFFITLMIILGILVLNYKPWMRIPLSLLIIGYLAHTTIVSIIVIFSSMMLSKQFIIFSILIRLPKIILLGVAYNLANSHMPKK
jgi:hypothetical protein